MEESRRNEITRREKSREGIKMARDVGKKREKNRQKAMEERKCFVCGGFGHIVYHCRNIKKEGSVQMLSNRFEVLRSKVMQRGEGSGKEAAKDRRKILREEKAKRGIEVQKTKVEKEKRRRNY